MTGQDRAGVQRAADDRTGQGRCTAAAEDLGRTRTRGLLGRTKVLYWRTGKQTSCCVRKEKEERKKEVGDGSF